VSQDNAEAAKWYRKAADQGHANAQYNLGVMYSTGQGVPQDYVEAHKWFNLAASRLTDSERDTAVKKRALMESKMTQSQIAEAQKLAREWKSR
jgi:TPR repeat protein